MRHLTIQQLSATVDDALSGVSLELVRRHLVECEECRQRGMRLSRIDAVMAQLVSHDPGDAWLAALAVEIEERVHSEVTGKFDAPAHPAGPPPLEAVAASEPLTPEQLDAIWEEGSTTPRPTLVRPAAEEAPAEATESAKAEVPTRETPAPKPAVAKVAPPEPARAAKAAVPAPKPAAAKVVPPEPARAAKAAVPAPKPAAAKVVPPEPARAATPPAPGPPVVKPEVAKAAPPKPARSQAPLETESSFAARVEAAAARRAAAAAVAPEASRGRGRSETGGRWNTHSERIARARREAQAPRETILPLTLGLVGGAVAGALVVTLVLIRHGGTGSPQMAPTAVPQHASSADAAVVDPVARPTVDPAPPPAEPAADTSPPAAAEPVTIPHAPPVVTATPPRSAPRTATHRAVSPSAATPTTGARALPTGEESWPLLCGEIVDESGAPVTGARILLADLDLGARTDRRGRFCLSAPPGDRTLSVVALGFVTQRRAVSVAAGAADLHLVLKAAP